MVPPKDGTSTKRFSRRDVKTGDSPRHRAHSRGSIIRIYRMNEAVKGKFGSVFLRHPDPTGTPELQMGKKAKDKPCRTQDRTESKE